MTYYPIMIPTLNRYVHFKRCVESLAKNTHADKTELVIGLDYPPSEKYVEGFNKIKNYIPTITGFKKVTIFERLENYGPDKNWEELQKYVFNHYDAVICSEDDNEFSPCFLDYMNKTLEYYWDDETVRSVSGYINPEYYDKLQTPLLFSYDSNGWGIGLWKHKEKWKGIFGNKQVREILLSYSKSCKIFKTSPALLSMLISMVKKDALWGDVLRSTLNILNNTYQLRPSYSLVRNIGHDGSGLHCSRSTSFLNDQLISDEIVFDKDMFTVTSKDNRIIKRLLFLHLMPSGFVRRFVYVLRIIKEYLFFRMQLSNIKK